MGRFPLRASSRVACACASWRAACFSCAAFSEPDSARVKRVIARLHLLATGHGEFLKLAGKRRGNIDKLTLDVTLEPILRSIAAARDKKHERYRPCCADELSMLPDEKRAHAFRPFVVSAPSRTIFKNSGEAFFRHHPKLLHLRRIHDRLNHCQQNFDDQFGRNFFAYYSCPLPFDEKFSEVALD